MDANRFFPGGGGGFQLTLFQSVWYFDIRTDGMTEGQTNKSTQPKHNLLLRRYYTLKLKPNKIHLDISKSFVK